MKKIYLTEEQFAQYIKHQIMESIIPEKDAGKFGASKLKKVTDYLANKARNASDDDDIIHQARANGINVDSLRGGSSKEYDDGYSNEIERTKESLLKEKDSIVKKWVGEYLPYLRASFNENMSMKKGYEEVPYTDRANMRDDNGEIKVTKTQGFFDTLDKRTQEEVWKLKDFLDKEGLTIIYRRANKPQSIRSRYGLTVNSGDADNNIGVGTEINWKTPIKDVLDAHDFSNISDSELRKYYSGTRIQLINKKLDALGYETNVTPAGKHIKVDMDSEAWNDKGAGKDIARAEKMKQLAERYVQRTYGMKFVFGDGKSVFSFGNKKVADDTVIINFEAALRCPAWNRCLLKDACYARNTEKNYDNTLNRNLRTNLIWQQTEGDEELTKLMLELIRSYIFNYDAAVKALNKIGYRGKVSKESLSEMSMSEIKDKFGDDVLQVMSDTKRANVVRLNEDGDFIGQWLVDMWDGWAADFKLAGVVVTAYTCRALNYEKVSNMILNISQEPLVAGQKSSAIAHYFFAVEPDEYKELEETYMAVKTDENGNEIKVPSNGGPSYDSNGQVTPMYRRLIDENGELQGYYYKCPCGRMDGSSSDEDELSEAAAEQKNNKVDCYRCRICYGRDADTNIVDENGEKPKSGFPVYVLVSAHGANKDEYDVQRSIGAKKKKIKQWLAIQAERRRVGAMNEAAEIGENDPVAIKQVVKNTVNSVANMMRQQIGANNAIMEAKNKFYEIFNNIDKNR